MAATPKLKVFNAKGEYIAACKHPEDAAAIVNIRGDGSTIRDGHGKSDIVWTEGAESKPAGESYDFVAETVFDRITARRLPVYRSVYPNESAEQVEARARVAALS